MVKPKLDRRVRYTRMIIKESFIKLLHKKPLAKITIKEICEVADINRATFYAHYSDQYDLLRQIQDELIKEILSYLDKYTAKGNEIISGEMLEMIFNYLKENAEICTLLLSDDIDMNFQKQVIMIFQNWCISFWAAKGEIQEQDIEYLYTFSAYGCIGIIKKWLDEGMKIPAKEMAKLTLKFTSQNLDI